MSLQAYQRAAQRAESPRELEYRLFGDVTRALMEAAKTPQTDIATRMAALDWNRRLWTTLSADCANPNNRLPPATRAQIISLAIWVARYTSAVARREGSFDLLVEVNRSVMQGLASRSEAA